MVTGRPPATSRDAIADAACELFLERGFAQVSVADIATRAGVSRSSFFNYFSSKVDVLWAGFDAQVGVLEDRLRGGADVDAALDGFAEGLRPDALALAYTHRAAMGLDTELEQDGAVRARRIARAVGARRRAQGAGSMAAEVLAAADAGAVLAALEEWVRRGVGTAAFGGVLREALTIARHGGGDEDGGPGSSRKL